MTVVTDEMKQGLSGTEIDTLTAALDTLSKHFLATGDVVPPSAEDIAYVGVGAEWMEEENHYEELLLSYYPRAHKVVLELYGFTVPSWVHEGIERISHITPLEILPEEASPFMSDPIPEDEIPF